MDHILHERVPVMEEILKITRQPGLSVGVIHQGHEVFKCNLGTKDTQQDQLPDSDTLYCIASLSKAFMSASLDILVQERKISWDDTIASLLPEFHHIKQPSILSHMTIQDICSATHRSLDICSHRTGLESLDEITQGMDGRILIPKANLIHVCNALPIKHDLRTRYLYNNAMYALAGHVVEQASEYSNWGDFQRERIFKPLGMKRTTAFRSVHEADTNIATPYMILTDGSPSKIAPTELSANSMNGGSGGIRSSVNDLLKWCKCLLGAFDAGLDNSSPIRFESPMFDRLTIANPRFQEDGDYCAGWCYHQTPGKFGLISPNPLSLLVYGHQGDVPGYTCNIYIIPETKSAIVVLSNGTGLSDATDWIAQDLIQTMHSLQPSIDFVNVANKAKLKYLNQYLEHYTAPLEKHRVPSTESPRLDDFVGSYTMEGLDIVCVDITKKSGDANTWDSALIAFKRNNEYEVTSLCWALNGVDVLFPKA
ncbi:beta-lactamase/transpeptidase-like protein [Nemania diffusa]|nr:beta-lactamase/transpeptidase-like protein [Nemania diffusa]